MSRWLLPGFLFVLVTALSGCGSAEEKTYPVKGKLMQGGNPFQVTRPGDRPLPPGDPGVRVKFARTDSGKADTHYAVVDPSAGTFDVPGPQGKGIPAGSYEVTVYSGAAGGEMGAGKGSGPPKGGMMMKGGPAATAPSMEGQEIARKQVTIPEGGVTDLVIEITDKKK